MEFHRKGNEHRPFIGNGVAIQPFGDLSQNVMENDSDLPFTFTSTRYIKHLQVVFLNESLSQLIIIILLTIKESIIVLNGML